MAAGVVLAIIASTVSLKVAEGRFSFRKQENIQEKI
jgi:hypothetical protein